MQYPDGVSGLILEAPHVFVEDSASPASRRRRTTYETTDFPQRLGRYHANVDATFWGWNDIWLDPAFRSWNIEEYVPKITCPVLCIQGEEDEYGTWRRSKRSRRGATDGDPDVAALQAFAASRPGGENAGAMGEFVEEWAAISNQLKTYRSRLIGKS